MCVKRCPHYARSPQPINALNTRPVFCRFVPAGDVIAAGPMFGDGGQADMDIEFGNGAKRGLGAGKIVVWVGPGAVQEDTFVQNSSGIGAGGQRP